MWQVSGRSDITDFEEVVNLDKEYINNWNIGLDIKILIRTVFLVANWKVEGFLPDCIILEWTNTVVLWNCSDILIVVFDFFDIMYC